MSHFHRDPHGHHAREVDTPSREIGEAPGPDL